MAADGFMSGRPIIRNALKNPRRQARIGTIIATWRAKLPASVLIWMISCRISSGWSARAVDQVVGLTRVAAEIAFHLIAPSESTQTPRSRSRGRTSR